MGTQKTKRSITLKLRQATVSNFNFQPEKKGPDELAERADLSLSFVVMDLDIDEIVNTKGNPLKLLWANDGTCQYREFGSMDLDLVAEGTLEIGVSDEHLMTFENAKLKKISITPFIDRQMGVKCQVRIDPTGHMEELGQLRIHQDAVMSFDGLGVEKGKNKDQNELEV